MRIREDVLERDYCLAWFLVALSESDLKHVLAFKGGTALKQTLPGTSDGNCGERSATRSAVD